MRVFVNAVPLEVGKGADVRAAVLALDADLEQKLVAGAAFVTDARGIELPLESALAEGAILRVVVTARRAGGEHDADA
jgi:hypothetical protein